MSKETNRCARSLQRLVSCGECKHWHKYAQHDGGWCEEIQFSEKITINIAGGDHWCSAEVGGIDTSEDFGCSLGEHANEVAERRAQQKGNNDE